MLTGLLNFFSMVARTRMYCNSLSANLSKMVEHVKRVFHFFCISFRMWQVGDAVDIFKDLEDGTMSKEEARNVLRSRQDLDSASLDTLFR